MIQAIVPLVGPVETHDVTAHAGSDFDEAFEAITSTSSCSSLGDQDSSATMDIEMGHMDKISGAHAGDYAQKAALHSASGADAG